MEALKFIFGWLVPAPDASPLWVYIHRLFIGVVLVAILLLLLNWNGGFIPRFGAVAMAADVKAQFDSVTLRQDRNDLLQVKIQLQQNVTDACEASEKGDQRRMDSANSNITLLADQYYALAKREFHKPPCEDVVVNWKDKKNSPP